MKKKLISLILSAAAALSVMPGAAVQAYDASDCYARNFLATDNSVWWNSCAQISWFNPSVDAKKISLYAKSGDNFILVGDDYDTTANASVVTTLNTGDWKNFPRAKWYTFKLVIEFEDGTTKDQMLDFYVPLDTVTNYANNKIWNIKTEVSEDFSTVVQRGGNPHGSSLGGSDFFPMSSEVVYDNGNPALKVWSNAHIASETDGDGYNSGNYYGEFMLMKNIEAGESYDISFKYKANGIENLVLFINNKAQNVKITNTDGEWETYTATVDAADNAGKFLSFKFECGNEEFIIDDVVVKKTGTDENLLTDGDFSALGASAPQMPENASVTTVGDNVVVSWSNVADSKGVNVYEVIGQKEIKRAFVKQGNTSATFTGDLSSKYVVKSVNAKGSESEGVECELPSYSDYEIAVSDPTVIATGRNGEIIISWQNSNCATIQRVRVEDETGAIVADSDNPPEAIDDDYKTKNPNKDIITTEAGEICHYTLSSYNNNEYHSFKIITETDFGSIEQTVSGVPSVMDVRNEFMVTDNMRMSYYRGSEATAFADVRYEIEKESGNNALKVINHYPNGWMPANNWVEFGVKAGELDLKGETQYKLEFKYKGSVYAWQKVFIHDQKTDGGGAVDVSSATTTVSNWSNFSKTFKTISGDDTQGFRVYFGARSGGPFWIDDIKLTEVDTGKVVYSEDFDSGVVEYDTAVTDVTATAGDESAVIKWNAPESAVEDKSLVKIFAETADSKYLAAIVDPSLGEYKINGLSNETDYTFTVQLCNNNGQPSEAKTASATPKAPDYKITNISLCNPAGIAINPTELKAGTYKVRAEVKNNGMGSGFTSQLIVCLYDGDMLYDVKATNVKTIPQTPWNRDPVELLTDTITVPDTTGHNFTIKAYVWDSLEKMNKFDSKAFFE